MEEKKAKEKNENCQCPCDSCERHGKCDECQEYHHSRGEETGCGK